jgi:hypothetical protein
MKIVDGSLKLSDIEKQKLLIQAKIEGIERQIEKLQMPPHELLKKKN